MIREICKDEAFLKQPSLPADAGDLPAADDLMDTLRANAWRCVGMAGNMIGVNKRFIAFSDEGRYMEMFNPVILKRECPYETEEGCLSFKGVRPAKRYRHIRVRYQTEDMRRMTRDFYGWTAQIIQHELDHCNGILI